MFADLKHQGFEEVFLSGPGTAVDMWALDAVLEDLDGWARVVIHLDEPASEAIDIYTSSGALRQALARGARIAFVAGGPEGAKVIEEVLACANGRAGAALVTTSQPQARRWLDR